MPTDCQLGASFPLPLQWRMSSKEYDGCSASALVCPKGSKPPGVDVFLGTLAEKACDGNGLAIGLGNFLGQLFTDVSFSGQLVRVYCHAPASACQAVQTFHLSLLCPANG